jgi:hypothetical protein
MTVAEYPCHKWPRMCSVCRYHKPVLSLIIELMKRVIRQVPQLPICPEHFSSIPGFSGFALLNFLSSVYCIVDHCLFLCPFSFCHCIVCPSLIYGFWLHLWYLLAIVLSVPLWFTASDYTFGIFWPLYCLSLFGLRLLITPFVLSNMSYSSHQLIKSWWLS